jgi:hypothetical protein
MLGLKANKNDFNSKKIQFYGWSNLDDIGKQNHSKPGPAITAFPEFSMLSTTLVRNFYILLLSLIATLYR